IFLIDVSGSMLSRSTMVKAQDGSQITLFEALRQALEQVAQDPRLIGAKSRISFITFGTKITEKTNWPAQIQSDKDRQALIGMIHSPAELDADKHGDTYMGGAISQALNKANEMYSQADPCTTTFIVMLTDGWDEPPAGATIKVKTVATQLAAKQRQVLAQLGVKTWQVLVIGLQRLPDRKAGTTTAKELAELLGGGFIDVTKQAGGTVSERIFLALKEQVEALKGQLKVAATSTSGRCSVKNGIVDFGTINGNGSATAILPLELKSCYAEEISALKEVSAALPAEKQSAYCQSARKAGLDSPKFCAGIPADAITIKLPQSSLTVSPESATMGERKGTIADVQLNAQAHSNCPAGQFVGCFRLTSSAKVPEFIPYMIVVPGRIVADPETIKVKVKKPGLFFSEPTAVELVGDLKEMTGSHSQAQFEVTVTPQSAVLVSGGSEKEKAIEATIARERINDGKPLAFTLDTSKTDHAQFRLKVAIPADQKPGRYEGKLALNVTGPSSTSTPTEIAYEIGIDPSAWEEVAPIAVPMTIILILVTGLGLILWVSNSRRD
ncbi:MAG TPA: vWA domain-containing protein, partial [Chroococcales cyanobacterium]